MKQANQIASQLRDAATVSPPVQLTLANPQTLTAELPLPPLHTHTPTHTHTCIALLGCSTTDYPLHYRVIVVHLHTLPLPPG
ncbi:unnamed protein product [Protopolystoma xenopodis]|uniref:Uncharacterized protein n=1 Tax=Protopolystoma xenopodis TaxID=117903 RepID=A0A3S5AXB8_9PLAT|nr:unnamed protein product [Protopolystoma xenopodis]